MCKHSLQGAVNVNFEPQYKILKNVCLLSRLDWNRSTAINTIQYNTIQYNFIAKWQLHKECVIVPSTLIHTNVCLLVPRRYHFV